MHDLGLFPMDERNHTSEFVHLGSTFGLLAVHGGGIEPGTEEIVRFVAHHSEASLYVYAGRRPAGNLSLHQPSHGTGLGSRPLVLRFLDHVKTAVSIHGHGRMQECAYVGGLHQTMVQRFVEISRQELPQYEWISDPEIIPPGIRGRNPNNIVNLLPDHGMQLELPRGLRETETAAEGRHARPAGDALVLSWLLVRFINMLMNENS